MKTVASVLNVVWYVFVGLVLGLFGAGIFIAIFGFLPETITFIVVVTFIVGMMLAGLFEGLKAFEARPRGLGMRRVKRWKDGKSYYDYERY